jgi:hypothetical protein
VEVRFVLLLWFGKSLLYGMITFQDSLLHSLKNYSTTHPNTTKDIVWLIGYNSSADDVILLSGVNSKEIDVLKDEQLIQSIIPGGLQVFGFYVYNISPTRGSSDQEELSDLLQVNKCGGMINPTNFRVAGILSNLTQTVQMLSE